MASSYPSSADALSNPASGDALSTGHAAQHANANDAIEAIEATLGLNPQGGSATVKARLDVIEAADWVTSTRILDGTIVNGDISASAAIDPSKVAQNVVTFSNADAVVATSTRKLAQIGTMSASRTVTLPAASGVAAGTELIVADLSGTVTSTNTIVIARAGSDTVNGATSVTIGAAYGWRRFVSDGSSKWVFDGGVLRTSDSGTITSANIADGTIVNADINASAAIDVSKLSGVVTSAGVGNLLTANQASFETSVPASGTNCTITQDATYAVDGTKSMLMTSLAAGAMDNSGSAYSVAIPGPGTYTVYAKFRSDQTAMGAVVLAVGSGITQDGARANATSSGWTTLYGTFSATAATTVSVYISTSGEIGHPSAGGQKLWIDTVGVWRGAGGLWSLPGTPIANLGTYTDESVGRRIFTWDTVNARWQRTYGDTGLRDISGLCATANGWSVTHASTWRLRRVGNVVSFSASLTWGTAPSSPTFVTAIPSGFGPEIDLYLPRSYESRAWVALNWAGISLYGATGSATDAVSATWTTAQAWPTTLPGTAVGTIPQ